MPVHSDTSQTSYAQDVQGHIYFKTVIRYRNGTVYTPMVIYGVVHPGKTADQNSAACRTIDRSGSPTETNTVLRMTGQF